MVSMIAAVRCACLRNMGGPHSPMSPAPIRTCGTPVASTTAASVSETASPSGLSPLTLIAYRSEEHTSELQSQSNLVCRLLLEKKKTKYHYPQRQTQHALR